MSADLDARDIAKRAAARAAAEHVETGMRLGLGTGSTAAWFVEELGARARRERLDLVCVPTSLRTGHLAERAGLRLVTLDEAGWLDLTVDGTDEFDVDLNLIKGGGGALLQEKIVATASDRVIVISDASKQVETLGAFPLPVDVHKLYFDQPVTRLHADGFILAQQLLQVSMDLLRFGDIRVVRNRHDDLNRLFQLTDVGSGLGGQRVAAGLCQINPAEIFRRQVVERDQQAQAQQDLCGPVGSAKTTGGAEFVESTLRHHALASITRVAIPSSRQPVLR